MTNFGLNSECIIVEAPLKYLYVFMYTLSLLLLLQKSDFSNREGFCGTMGRIGAQLPKWVNIYDTMIS